MRMTKRTNKQVACKMCDEIFPDYRALNGHMNKHKRKVVVRVMVEGIGVSKRDREGYNGKK
jgi:hypothetical protein